MKIEDQIEFADVAEVLVKYFYEALHELEDNELIFVLVDDGDEVETGEALVDDFVLFIVEEVAHLGLACDYHLVDLSTWNLTYFRMRCF
jgi:hypothetical protein